MSVDNQALTAVAGADVVVEVTVDDGSVDLQTLADLSFGLDVATGPVVKTLASGIAVASPTRADVTLDSADTAALGDGRARPWQLWGVDGSGNRNPLATGTLKLTRAVGRPA